MLPQKIVMTLKIFLPLNYDLVEMHNIKLPDKNKLLSLFCINTFSLDKNFDDLQNISSCTKKL